MPIPLGILAAAGAGAGAAGSYDLLETTVLSSAASSVTFSSLGSYSAYKHLQIRATARTDRSSTIDNALIRLNSDSGSNYAYHELRGNGSNVASSASTSQTYAWGFSTTAASSIANTFGAGIIDILDFGSSSKNTTIRILEGQAGDFTFIYLRSGLWNNTSAVTSLQLFPNVGPNFVSGSRFSLYGVK